MKHLFAIALIWFAATAAQANDNDPPVDFLSCQKEMDQSVVDAKNMIIRDSRLSKDMFTKIGVSEPFNIGWEYFKRYFYVEGEDGTVGKIEIEFWFVRGGDEGELCERVEIQDYVY